MKPSHNYVLLALMTVTLNGMITAAHVPYLEESDYSPSRPFLNLDVTQSIAAYAWLESATDVDVYVCWVDRPERLFVEILVPVCPAYETFFPSFAVVGPWLPPPAIPLTGGYGLYPVPWTQQTTPRDTFYEPFGGKSYYQGPSFDMDVSVPGFYFLLCWDPQGHTGDYVLPIGFEERWPAPALLRALVNTPKIRDNQELHSPCGN